MPLTTPDQIAPNSPDYQDDAWKQWTPAELGTAVAFFLKRSTHRVPGSEKQGKDLTDARNYLAMLQAHIDEACQSGAANSYFATEDHGA